MALRAKIARLQQHLTQYRLVKVPPTCIPGNIPESSVIRHFHNRNTVVNGAREVSVTNFYVYVPRIQTGTPSLLYLPYRSDTGQHPQHQRNKNPFPQLPNYIKLIDCDGSVHLSHTRTGETQADKNCSEILVYYLLYF